MFSFPPSYIINLIGGVRVCLSLCIVDTACRAESTDYPVINDMAMSGDNTEAVIWFQTKLTTNTAFF